MSVIPKGDKDLELGKNFYLEQYCMEDPALGKVWEVGRFSHCMKQGGKSRSIPMNCCVESQGSSGRAQAGADPSERSRTELWGGEPGTDGMGNKGFSSHIRLQVSANPSLIIP